MIFIRIFELFLDLSKLLTSNLKCAGYQSLIGLKIFLNFDATQISWSYINIQCSKEIP